jgi:hypothetical protein
MGFGPKAGQNFQTPVFFEGPVTQLFVYPLRRMYFKSLNALIYLFCCRRERS